MRAATPPTSNDNFLHISAFFFLPTNDCVGEKEMNGTRDCIDAQGVVKAHIPHV